MSRSLRNTVVLSALITVAAACADFDPVRPGRAPSQPPVTVQPPASGSDQWVIHVLRVGDTTSIALAAGSGPVWSPDGGRMVFLSQRGGKFDLYLINRDGTGLSQLTNSGLTETPSWSPDGSRIAWMSEGSLKVMNSDGSNQLTLARSTPLFSKLRMGSWSPDGQRLAFVDPVDGRVHVANADGSGQLALAYSGGAPTAIFEPPAWSPDGNQIAFVVQGEGSIECVYDNCTAIDVMSAKGGKVTVLANGDSEDDAFPIWSPDGSSIAFVSYRGGDCGDWCNEIYPELNVMNADGTGRRKLTGMTGMPQWSADGRSLIVATSDSLLGAGLVTIPAAGGPARRLSSAVGALSPDGQWIAFAKLRQ